jgi:hypothetical protein
MLNGAHRGTSSRRVRGLAASGVNLLNNMAYERYEQLST